MTKPIRLQAGQTAIAITEREEQEAVSHEVWLQVHRSPVWRTGHVRENVRWGLQ